MHFLPLHKGTVFPRVKGMNSNQSVPLRTFLLVIGAAAIMLPVAGAALSQISLFKPHTSTSGNSILAFSQFGVKESGGVIRSWQQGETPESVWGQVAPSWYQLDYLQKQQELDRLWHAWAACNSPANPTDSTLKLFTQRNNKDYEVGHVRFNARGRWELMVQ